MGVQKAFFGHTDKGQEIFLFTLTNSGGLMVKIINYGGIITSLLVPDRDGNVVDVVLGFTTLPEYLASHPYFGAIIGRFANRIAAGRFSLDGKEYRLACNDGANHLHGGNIGFDKVVWDAEKVSSEDGSGIKLHYLSIDEEEGYPGNLDVNVEYLLTDRNELRIKYEATTDQPTIINLTNHSYFNLAGEGNGDILDHEIMINADRFTVVTPDLIPTGELQDVAGSAFDFRAGRTIGERIAEVPGGYDHNFALNKGTAELVLAAKVREPQSGRMLEIYTTEPGMQFYTGNFLDGTLIGKTGRPYGKHAGFCLETQHFPDSPNHPEFPAVTLRPGETYQQLTVYRFVR